MGVFRNGVSEFNPHPRIHSCYKSLKLHKICPKSMEPCNPKLTNCLTGYIPVLCTLLYSDVTGNSVTCKKSFQVYSITFSQGPKTEKEMVAGHRFQSTLRKHVLLFKYKRNIFLQWI